MIRYRIRIVLLSLGVLIGYGSAFSRFVYGRPLFGHHYCDDAAQRTHGALHSSHRP